MSLSCIQIRILDGFMLDIAGRAELWRRDVDKEDDQEDADGWRKMCFYYDLGIILRYLLSLLLPISKPFFVAGWFMAKTESMPE